jgi:cell wall-associated NlpC family hydrolase
MSHWAESYIGKPWENGKQGPHAFDCYGLVRAVYADQLGITLPIIPTDAENVSAIRASIAAEQQDNAWQPVEELHDFDIVLLSQAHTPEHVGVWVCGSLLHCIRKAGVVYQTGQALRRHGWRIVAQYRFKGIECTP